MPLLDDMRGEPVAPEPPVTPHAVERRLLDLGRELDTAHEELVQAESDYFNAKATYEVTMARTRMSVASEYATLGVKATVQEKEDAALVRVADEVFALGVAEAKVRAARGNVARVRTQVDICRSVGTSVRTSLDLS